MKQRLLALWLLLTAATAAVFAANTLSLSGLSGEPGATVTVTVSLGSDVAAEGLQLSLVLPEGTAYVANSSTATGRASGMQASGGVRDGRLNITLFTTGRNTIAAGSGEVLSFALHLGATPLSAPLRPSAILAAADGSGIDVTCAPAVLAVEGAAIALGQREFSLGRVALGEAQTLTVPVTNTGTRELRIDGIAGGAGWTVPEPVAVAPGATAYVPLSFVPCVRGRADEVMRFTGNASGADSPLIVHSEGFGRNEVSLSADAVRGGEEAAVSVAMKNYDPVCGFTLKVRMPRGFSYVPGSAAIDGTRGDGHDVTATVADLDNGATELTLTGYSLTNKPFAGNDGTMANFRILAASRYGATIELNKAILPAVLPEGVTDVVSATSGMYLGVSSPQITTSRRQDIGRTPVTQRAAGSFAISNQGPEPLIISAVDCPDEALALVTPLPLTVAPWSGAELAFERSDEARGTHTALMTIRSNDPETPSLAVDVDMERYAPNELSLSAEEADAGAEVTFAVGLDNYDAVEGLQFDILTDAALAGTFTAAPSARAKGFSISVEHVAPGRARILAYTLGTPIAPGSGEVMTLSLVPDTPTEEGTYSLTASDIIIGDAAMANVHSATVVPQTDVTVFFFLLGDLNADRKVSAADLNMMMRKVLNPDLESIKTRPSDINKDGNISPADLNLHYKLVLNNE